MVQIFTVAHPIALDTKIRAEKPNCPCKGGGMIPVVGVVKKIIHNQTGYWYYLSSGVTVSSAWVKEIL